MAIPVRCRGPYAAAAGVLIALLAGLLVPSARAGGDEGSTLNARIAEHSRRLAEDRRDRDIHGIHEEIWNAVALYREAQGADACQTLGAKLVREVGALCRHGDDRIRRAAIEALGAMRDEGGARYLRPFLKPGSEKPADPLTLAAIDSSAAVRDASLVDPLLRIVERCPCPLATRRAVEALSGYCQVESKRVEIVLGLLAAARAEAPADEDAARASEEDLARWRALSAAVPPALSRLTGHEASTLDEWFRLVDERKGDVSGLFETEAG